MTTPIPSLLYGDVERDLRSAVRDLLAERADWTSVLRRVDGDNPYDEALWKTLATELGLAGLLVPEERGGQGATGREVGVVLEELGRSVAPVPYLASAVLATTALVRAGSTADDAVATLAAGAQVATLLVPATTSPDSGFPGAVAATREAGGVRLSGAVRAVLAGDLADLLVVPCLAGGGPLLALVTASEQGVRRQRAVSLDPTRPVSDVTLDSAPGVVIAEGDAAAAAVHDALIAGAALLASEQLGLAEQALGITVDYLKVRHQFGRPIGAFQALKHRAADLWGEVNNARAAARYAAACLSDSSPDLPVAAALAQAYCSQAAVHAAEECVQLHGGIGFTWEHPAHLYVKRAMAQSLLLGTPDRHRAALASLVDLPPA